MGKTSTTSFREGVPACILCGFSPHALKKLSIHSLVEDGVNLTTRAGDIEAQEHWRENKIFSPQKFDDALAYLFEKYQHWLCDIRRFFQDKKNDASIFYEHTGIPDNISGIGYGDVRFMKLVTRLRTDISSKLKQLRRRESGEPKNVSHSESKKLKTIFFLALYGALYRKLEDGGKQTYDVGKGTVKYRILDALVDEYVPISTKELASRIGDKITAAYFRKEINVLRSEIEQHFAGVISGEEFIPTGKRGIGYCLGQKVKIHRE